MNDFSSGNFFALLTIINSLVSIIGFSKLRIFSLLNPFVTAHMVLISIFGLRPLVMHYPFDFSFYGLDAVTGFNASARLGFVASSTLTLGFLAAKPSKVSLVPDFRHSTKNILRRARIVSLSLFALWLVFMIFVGGSSVFSLLAKGRSTELNSYFSGVPIALQALPAASFVVFCASILILKRHESLGKWIRVELVALFLLTAAPSALVGDRRIIVPMAICMLITIFSDFKSFRLGIFSSLGFSLIGLVLTIYPFVRSSGARNETNLLSATYIFFQDNGLSQVVRSFLVKNDTEMFNFVSFLSPRMGDEYQYGYGRGTFVDLFRESLPSALSASHTWSDMILTKMFGGGCASGLCPVPSLVGVLMYDFGILGVAAGFFLIGFFMRRFETLLTHSGGIKLVATLTLGAYCAVIVRGSAVAMIWIALNVIFLSYLGLKFVFQNLHSKYETEVVE